MREVQIQGITESTNAIYQWSYSLLQGFGLSESMTGYLNMIILSSVLVLFVYVSQKIAQSVVCMVLKRMSQRMEFSEKLLKNRFPHYLAMLLPFSLVKVSIPIIFEPIPSLVSLLMKGMDIYLALYVVWLVKSVVRSGGDMLEQREAFKDKPVNSIIQVISIILYFVATVVIIAILIGKSPKVLFAGLGAISAVLMLVFKDTILGFVASVQLSTNDMVRIGDWITVPGQAADGTVLKISLTTVKVQNFDNTIVTIPTYALISGSVQNWRGMQDSGTRRIQRSVRIKQSSIRYIRDEELPYFEKIQELKPYIEQRSVEIRKHNEKLGVDRELLLNGRNLTNIGLFRKYVEVYLKNSPLIDDNSTLMVRQLEPTSTGLPLQIYVFAKTTIWTKYESIMADIFDHITASVKYFDLEIYEDLSTINTFPVESKA